MSQNLHQSVQPSVTRVRFLAGLVALGGALMLGGVWPSAQGAVPGLGLIVGRNVNLVSGQTLPNGDPYLQRQNEPSVAASTRNPLHLLAGANDYRTVDIPGNFEDGETGDAWLGVFKSFDGGERWQSTLLPGYPQDTSAEGMASPLKAYHAGADPVVRPGTNGLLYYAGLAFNRGEGGASAIFVSRFVDNNNKENGDPIAYISTTVVASSTGAAFLDKPWMAVDVPRAGAKVCRITTQQPAPKVLGSDPRVTSTGNGASGVAVSAAAQTIKTTHTAQGTPTVLPTPGITKATTVSQQVLAGAMYVAYAQITTTTLAAGAADIESRIMFSRSDDCGATWTTPVRISDPAHKVNQGATIAVDPTTGVVHVAWRQFGLTATASDSIMAVTPDITAKVSKKPVRVHEFKPGPKADAIQPKLQRAHRHGDVNQLVSIRPFDSGTGEDRFRTNAYPTMAIDDESRVYVAWTERGYAGARPDPLIGDARVVLATSKTPGVWTTPRTVDSQAQGTDLPGHQMMPSMSYSGGRLLLVYYDLRQDVSRVFGPFVSERDAIAAAARRHTIDVRAVQAPKGDVPVFGASTLVSQYLMGNLRGAGGVEPQQLQFNAPNLPLFQLGTVPFMGDYIDVAPAPAFVQNPGGTWIHNTANTSAPVFHAVWTDNRDVRQPKDRNWQNYTPPGGAGCVDGQTGMRNQNVYSARITMGLMAGSPGNTKPLSAVTPRGFVVFAQNLTYQTKAYRLTIENQPVGGSASFNQLGLATPEPLLLTVDVKVAPRSMVTRTVYATSTNAKEQVRVSITEVGLQDFLPVVGGLATTVVLNPDISNPDISNPDISNPDISNPDISNPDISNAEVYNPDISNPDISNPDISNPDISNPDISNPDISNVRIANPDISNPDISNPDISNPDISNPDISNPDISNPDISNGSLTDVTWTIRNDGNTTASFNVNLFIANQSATAGGIKTQLVVHKTYKTPVSDGCVLKSQTQTVLVANVLNPTFKTAGDDTTFDPANPDISNTTLWLEPGGEGKITLRIVDPKPTDNIGINPVTDVTPVIQSLAVNTQELSDPTPEPPATPLPTDPPAPPSPTETKLSFVTQPANTLVGGPIPDVIVRALTGGNPAPGVQVTIAIAINPSGGKLDGVVTVLTDAAGLATFGGLSIDRDGAGYRLSASAAAAEAMPILSNVFTVGALSPFVVTNTADSLTVGTLRNAITAANLTLVQDTITFAIPGPGPHTIQVLTRLPTIAQPLVIDGTTQPGYDGAPMVRIDGLGLVVTPGLEAGAFNVTARSTVRGLMITNFTNGSGWGLWLNGASSQSIIEDNIIGTDRAGTAGLGNKGGLTATFGVSDVVVRNNVVSGNTGFGLSIIGTARTSIVGNRVGTGPDGGSALPNGASGIYVGSASQDTLIDSNVISGNSQLGIIASTGTNPRIVGNTIGLGADGLTRLPNAQGGILLSGTERAVVGALGGQNVISGNGVYNAATPAPCDVITGGYGILVTGGVSVVMPVIQNNLIGTDATGEVAVPNLFDGIVLHSPARVGGAGVDEGNVIAGNGCAATQSGTGIIVTALNVTPGTVIQGNVVGLSKVTQSSLGNGFSGITVMSPAGVLIGGAAPGEGNVISGNPFSGIAAYGTPAPAGIVVKGNKIGTGSDGVTPKPNGTQGISLGNTAGATIGGLGLGEGNLIAHNAARGVLINGTSMGVSVLSNRIFGNGDLGIDLAPLGVSPNDGGDGDAGVNGRQNFPVLSNVSNAGVATTFNYTLDSLQINAVHTIQVFANSVCDVSGNGEGERLVGSFQQISDGGGDMVVVGAVLNELVPAGQFLTATATDAAGNTSEFSQCIVVPAPVAPNPFIVTNTSDAGLGSLRFAMTEANTTMGLDSISFNIPGPGPHTITLGSPLPAITDKVTIDGRTQHGYDNRPMVRVDGTGTGARGFELRAESEILGLSITGFTADAGVLVMGTGDRSVIQFNHVGTDRAGAGGMGNALGVKLNYTTGVVVLENLISGNSRDGVVVVGGGANEIRSNYVGTGIAGLGVLSNSDNGIVLFDGANGTVIDGNVISGNGTIGVVNGFGIDVQQSGGLDDVTNTVITNNIIGLDANGTLIDRGGAHYIDPGPAATDFGPIARGNSGGGIRINRGPGTIIGGAGGGNTISGNAGTGIRIEGPMAVAPVITRNRVGTDPAGTVARGNAVGIDVFLASAMIGGPASIDRNIVSGNIRDGIAANGHTTIENNFVGTDVTGTLPVGNSLWNGPDCCHTNIFVTAPNNIVRGNVVAANNAHNQNPGIRSGGALGGGPNIIEDNMVGTDVTGALALGNGVGIGLFGDKSGTVVRRNVIANNLMGGVWLVEGTQGARVGGSGNGNTIRNNGLGIMVGDNASALDSGNSLLSNLIFGNTNLGIDLAGNGVTVDDVGDSDSGPNGMQNFGVLSNVVGTGPETSVDILVDTDTTNANYEIQVFASTACHTSGFGQGQRQVGTWVLSSNGAGDIVASLGLTEAVPPGQWLTATVTQVATGSTSEFSACVVVPAGATGSITSASPANGAPNDGFIVLQGTNLPAGIGNVVAEVSNGVTTLPGFWFGGASSATAAYVRLPGLPLGPATVRLRNNAGTFVTNAFPITITAVPGTPVITAIRDGALNVVAAPVAAGSTIYVGAYGTDTTGAVVRFTQGGNTWDVAAGTASSNDVLGLIVQVNVPGGAAPGPIDVSIRQGASAFSAPVTIQIAVPPLTR